MKIVAQIEKLQEGQYQLNGKIFDSFLTAHREMEKWVKRHKEEQKNQRSVISRISRST